MSLASEQAAEAQRTSTASNYYNIQAGPVYLRFQGELGIEFNDNATYSSSNPDAEIALRPNLNVRAYWPVTAENSIALSTGIGYVEYLPDTLLSHINIASDSGVNFKIYSQDFVFDLHDRFSVLDYQIQDPAVSAIFIRLENTAGVKVDWDLNKLILSLGYDYDLFSSIIGNYQYSDNTSDLFSSQSAFLINSLNRVGLEAGGGLTTYDQNVLDNSTHFSAGPFYQAQLTPNIWLSARAGFASYQFDHNGTVTNLSDFNGYYADLTVAHRINSALSHSLTAGREIQLGVTTELSEAYYVHYQAKWKVVQNVSTTFDFEYDHGNTSGSGAGVGAVEIYNRYGPGVGLVWQMTQKLAGKVTYSFLIKESDVSTLSYSQNRLLFDFTYAF